MIKRNTWILLGIFVVVAGFAYYLQNRPAPEGPVATPTAGGQAALFPNVDEKTISSLSVKDKDGKSLTIGRDSAGLWAITEPVSSQPTDATQAEESVTQVISLTGEPILNQQADIGVYGLANPSAEISLTFSGGQKDTLLVGDKVPIGDGYYASLNAGPVQVITSYSLDPILNLPTHPPFPATATPEARSTPAISP